MPRIRACVRQVRTHTKRHNHNLRPMWLACMAQMKRSPTPQHSDSCLAFRFNVGPLPHLPVLLGSCAAHAYPRSPDADSCPIGLATNLHCTNQIASRGSCVKPPKGSIRCRSSYSSFGSIPGVSFDNKHRNYWDYQGIQLCLAAALPCRKLCKDVLQHGFTV
jgi:hypothetical protein